MKNGKLIGIGVGPGDNGLITVKGAEILERTKHVFVPKARLKADSVALEIAEKYIGKQAEIHEIIFPMTEDRNTLTEHWEAAANQVATVLLKGEDACFLTLGDALLYSTYIYLLRTLKKILPTVEVLTVPGVTAYSAVSALTNFPVGEGKNPITIIPTSDDLEAIRNAISFGGTVILMKVGKRLVKILEILNEYNLLEQSVFIARAGLEGENIETDLRKLYLEKDQLEGSTLGYLSTILVNAGAKRVG